MAAQSWLSHRFWPSTSGTWRGVAREVAVAMSNKLSFLLYPMILKTSASYDDVMEIFAKKISTYFVMLEFLNMQGIQYRI
jgi:hypothetical protein